MKVSKSPFRYTKIRILVGVILGSSVGFGETQTPLFQVSDRCIACHNRLTSVDRRDVSLGHAWDATMMANAARDPYWQAGVRRETLEHPSMRHEIENECSKCHMPMAHVEAHAQSRHSVVFDNLTEDTTIITEENKLAQDGVSCSLCHQIQPTNLGRRESLTGGFVVDTQRSISPRLEFGPYLIDAGRSKVMSSASKMTPVLGRHLESSEFCATCHTLYTHALNATGQIVGTLPEQVPYQEWAHSSYRNTHSCQNCHMPVTLNTSISSVAGQVRPKLFEHQFVGGNFFVLDVFGSYGESLNTRASRSHFELASERTRTRLSIEAAHLDVSHVNSSKGSVAFVVSIRNLGGHKLPTAYPARRVWLHVRIEDAQGAALFESGALTPSGAILGNDNDENPSLFEPHYDHISKSSEVAIYEAILGTPEGQVTTGLLSASRYLKDNRLLPLGFDKSSAAKDIAVHGSAATDTTFVGGSDRVTYEITLPRQDASQLTVELLYQPIGYAWAHRLRDFSATEPIRFTKMYTAMSQRTAVVLARAKTPI
jgi:hypothetical protein